MAVLEIKRAGDPVLKKVCEPVKRIDKKVKRILKDMSDTRIVGEGCLSVPNFEGEVERAEYVECEFTDPRGKKQFIAADGLLAICLQHETDHLDGILFTDKAITITLKTPEE